MFLKTDMTVLFELNQLKVFELMELIHNRIFLYSQADLNYIYLIILFYIILYYIGIHKNKICEFNFYLKNVKHFIK